MHFDLVELVKLFTGKAGTKDLIIFCLLIVLVFERWSSTRASGKITNSIIRALYERGHLTDRRKKQLPIGEDRRQ
jgi:hypothetical protein